MSKFIKFLNEEVNVSSIIYAITLKLYNETANMQTDAQKLHALLTKYGISVDYIKNENVILIKNTNTKIDKDTLGYLKFTLMYLINGKDFTDGMFADVSHGYKPIKNACDFWIANVEEQFNKNDLYWSIFTFLADKKNEKDDLSNQLFPFCFLKSGSFFQFFNEKINSLVKNKVDISEIINDLKQEKYFTYSIVKNKQTKNNVLHIELNQEKMFNADYFKHLLKISSIKEILKLYTYGFKESGVKNITKNEFLKLFNQQYAYKNKKATGNSEFGKPGEKLKSINNIDFYNLNENQINKIIQYYPSLKDVDAEGTVFFNKNLHVLCFQGTWNDGEFIFNGHLKMVFWKSTWNGGTLKNGYFFSGIWNHGDAIKTAITSTTWNGGKLLSGSFNHGTWIEGILEKSIIKNSKWENGSFISSKMENCSIYSDKYKREISSISNITPEEFKKIEKNSWTAYILQKQVQKYHK